MISIIKFSVLLQVLLLLFSNNCFAKEQLSFNVSENILFPDFTVKIDQNVLFPDIVIKIGKDVIFGDFTVGVTSNRRQADFIINNSTLADYSVKAGPNVMFSDLTIKAGPDVMFSDITIKIQTSGTVDWIVYTEKDFMNLTDLVIALLPITNLKTNHEHEVLNSLFNK